MLQILSIHPGTVVLPGIKHGDIIRIVCAIDQRFHSEITAVVSEVGKTRLCGGDPLGGSHILFPYT